LLINTWFFVFGPKHHRHHNSLTRRILKLDSACNNAVLHFFSAFIITELFTMDISFCFRLRKTPWVFQTDFYGWLEVHHFQMDLCQQKVIVLNIT